VQVWRVGFNAGDRAFWFRGQGYIPYQGAPADWTATFTAICAQHAITDIVLYGDTRPIHAEAVQAANAAGLTVHVFEEGYMRPHWVTYERGGSNGNSRLMEMSVPQMQQALEMSDMDVPEPPAHWGDMRQHVFYGALYHWFVMFRNRDYRNFRPHRDVPLGTETMLYTRRLLLMPLLVAICGAVGVGAADWLATAVWDIDKGAYWDKVRTYVDAYDIVAGLLKGVFFGGIISLVACRKGLHTEGGAAGVGTACT
jgi:hypothetical protein